MNLIRRYPAWAFVVLVVGTPYAVLLPLLSAGVPQEDLKGLKLLFAFTPLLYVVLVTRVLGGEEATAALFAKLWRPGVPARWYVASLSVFAVVAFAALGIRWGQDGFFPARSEFASLGKILIMSPLVLLFPGFTEEFGWRGFLQSRMQARMHWWWASVLTGIVWGSWHGFDFLIGNWRFVWPAILGYPVYIISTSVLVGWCYKHSGDCVFVAMLAHFGANIVNFFTPVFEEYGGSALPAVLYMGGLALVAVLIPVVEWAWQRLRRPAAI